MVTFKENIRGYPGYPHMDEEIYIDGKGLDATHPGIQGALKNVIGNSDNILNMIVGTPTITQSTTTLTFTGTAFCNGTFTDFDSVDIAGTAVNDYIFAKADGTLAKSTNMYDVEGSLICKVTSISSGTESYTPLWNKRFIDSGVYKWQISERLSLLSDTTYYPNGHTIDATGKTFTLTATAVNLTGTLDVSGDFAINTNVFTVDSVTGNTNIGGNLTVTGDLDVGTGKLQTINSSDLVKVNAHFKVADTKFTVDYLTGDGVFAGALDVGSDFTVNTNKFVVTSSNGNTAIAGTLDVTGNLTVNTDKFSVDSTTGETNVLGNLKVATNKFTVDSVTGNTVSAGTLTAAGGNLTVSGTTLDMVDTISARYFIAYNKSVSTFSRVKIATGDESFSGKTATIKPYNQLSADRIFTLPDVADSYFVMTGGSQTISGTKTFSTLPISSVTPSSGTQLVTKSYTDSKINRTLSLFINSNLPAGTRWVRSSNGVYEVPLELNTAQTYMELYPPAIKGVDIHLYVDARSSNATAPSTVVTVTVTLYRATGDGSYTIIDSDSVENNYGFSFQEELYADLVVTMPSTININDRFKIIVSKEQDYDMTGREGGARLYSMRIVV